MPQWSPSNWPSVAPPHPGGGGKGPLHSSRGSTRKGDGSSAGPQKHIENTHTHTHIGEGNTDLTPKAYAPPTGGLEDHVYIPFVIIS